MDVPYSFEESYREWERVPIDDVAYLSADELLFLHPLQLTELAGVAHAIRFDPNQWRNRDGKMTAFMGLPSLEGKTVLDFGCGFGMDALTFALVGKANVILADLHPKMLMVAERVVHYHTGVVPKMVFTRGTPPWFNAPPLDLFWSMGVLHHTPYAGPILQRACQLVKPGGQCKIMLYSDRMWHERMKVPLPTGPTWLYYDFMKWVRASDPVGVYADWYNQSKLEELVAPFAKVVDCQYISDDVFLAATLEPL